MNTIATIFIIMTAGYLIGRITVKGVNLGSSGVILVALIFGHFGWTISKDIQNLGLICFVTSVGYIAGPIFFRNFKKKAFTYVGIGTVIIAVGTLLCIAAILLFDLPSALAAGLMCGALTSTPGLAAALEAGGDAIASVGYGVAYPFGVLGVVLFVQLIPRLMPSDINGELRLLNSAGKAAKRSDGSGKKLIEMDAYGLMMFSLAAAMGIALGSLSLPLPGGAVFSLGLSGGPLLSGLIVGHFGAAGSVSLKVPQKTLTILREFGMVLFLAGAGCSAGNGFVEVLQTYGVNLFVIGLVMTIVPMLVGFFVAVKLLKLMPFTALGAICGGMTSTPALGSLISVAGTDMIATAYAATYPIALVGIVLAAQAVCVLF